VDARLYLGDFEATGEKVDAFGVEAHLLREADPPRLDVSGILAGQLEHSSFRYISIADRTAEPNVHSKTQ
jgi:hypothetical protein